MYYKQRDSNLFKTPLFDLKIKIKTSTMIYLFFFQSRVYPKYLIPIYTLKIVLQFMNISNITDGSGGSGGAPAISPVSWAANSPAVVEPSDGEEQLGKLAPTMATPSWVEEGSFPSAITSKNVPIGGIIPSMAARSLISNTPFYDLIITMPAIILTALNICTLV